MKRGVMEHRCSLTRCAEPESGSPSQEIITVHNVEDGLCQAWMGHLVGVCDQLKVCMCSVRTYQNVCKSEAHKSL